MHLHPEMFSLLLKPHPPQLLMKCGQLSQVHDGSQKGAESQTIMVCRIALAVADPIISITLVLEVENIPTYKMLKIQEMIIFLRRMFFAQKQDVKILRL